MIPSMLRERRCPYGPPLLDGSRRSASAYVAMRALRDPTAFLPSDLGVRHALEQLGEDGRPASVVRLAERWRPYRAYAVQHLWAQLASDSPAAHATTSTSEPDRLAA